MTCQPCADLINRWIDAFQDHGPIHGWRQHQASPEARRVRSQEMYSIKVEERAALIRQQIAAIRESCNHAAAATEEEAA